jgi:large subunit ribosomal protein L38
MEGKSIVNYLPPFPMRGTGWHRCVFIVYEHDAPIEFDEIHCENFDLAKRAFKTLDFYLKYQKQITPVGLSFFQCQWDASVKKIFHDKLSKMILILFFCIYF